MKTGINILETITNFEEDMILLKPYNDHVSEIQPLNNSQQRRLNVEYSAIVDNNK